MTWWAGVLGGLSWALWGCALPDGPDDQGLPGLLGLLFAVTLPAVARHAALFEARFARTFLEA